MDESREPEALTRAMGDAMAATRAFGIETQRVMKTVGDEFRRGGAGGRDFGRALSDAFEGIALKGRSLSDVLRKLALDISRMALENAIKGVSGAISGKVARGIGSLIANADGNVIEGGRVRAFAKGGVVSSPVLFPLRGGTGLMGEAGAEAIMPLKRGADGRLGVSAEGNATPASIVFNVTAQDAESFRRSESQIAAMLSRVAGRGSRNL